MNYLCLLLLFIFFENIVGVYVFLYYGGMVYLVMVFECGFKGSKFVDLNVLLLLIDCV